MKNKIYIAVISTHDGFRRFLKEFYFIDIENKNIQFVEVSEEYQCAGRVFADVLIHWSAQELREFNAIKQRCYSRIRPIK